MIAGLVERAPEALAYVHRGETASTNGFASGEKTQLLRLLLGFAQVVGYVLVSSAAEEMVRRLKGQVGTHAGSQVSTFVPEAEARTFHRSAIRNYRRIRTLLRRWERESVRSIIYMTALSPDHKGR